MAPDTQLEAWDKSKRTAPKLREEVLDFLTTVGNATADEVAEGIRRLVVSTRATITYLRKGGEIVDTGERRVNGNGNRAIVWKLSNSS